MVKISIISSFLLFFYLFQNKNHFNQKNKLPSDYSNWTIYGGTNDAARYSALNQINADNAHQLKVAWTYHTGDLDTNNRGQMQCNPIIVEGIMYATSAKNKLCAVNAATGEQVWQFDPFEVLGGANSWAGTSRGVSYWTDGNDKRILFCAGSYLLAVDAKTGQLIPTFGDGGKVDMQKDLDYHKDKFFIVSNTPGVVYKDMIILGMRLSEGLDAAPGHIRAFDVRTGKRRWIFHTIPHPSEFGYDTWKNPNAWRQIGGANCWAGMCLDEKRGLVFAATGSATYDFWGGYRLGDNLFANCIIALDANTGQRKWHYQTIHHDLWDRDLPANPNLVQILRGGKIIDAVAQITKHGFTFVLDRETGKPIFPIKEMPVPQSDLQGEKTAKTQPFPTLPEPFMRQNFTEKDIIDISPAHHAEILPRFKALKSGNMFIPPTLQGSVLFPGFDGGGEWGGASYDPQSNMLYVNANEMPWVFKMQKNDKLMTKGKSLYLGQCANCHGADRKGNAAAFPTLLGLSKKYTPPQLGELLVKGKGAMPSYKHLSDKDRSALVNYLLELKEALPIETKEVTGESDLIPPYTMLGYERFMTQDGYPAIRPPWGTLNAINLNTGKIVWKVPLGAFDALTAKGIPATGTENYGGPVNTAGDIIFIAASKDERFRVFNKKTGAIVFETKLPAGGYATPSVYEVNGKQYVVIACGGGKMGTKSGDSYVAFAL